MVGAETAILVRTTVVSNFTLFDVVRRFEWSENHPVTYSTVFLLHQLEYTHELFPVPTIVGPCCCVGAPAP